VCVCSGVCVCAQWRVCARLPASWVSGACWRRVSVSVLNGFSIADLLMLNYPTSPEGLGKVNTHQLGLIYFTVPQQPGIKAGTLSRARKRTLLAQEARASHRGSYLRHASETSQVA